MHIKYKSICYLVTICPYMSFSIFVHLVFDIRLYRMIIEGISTLEILIGFYSYLWHIYSAQT